MQLQVTFLDNGFHVEHTDLWFNEHQGTQIYKVPEVWIITKGNRLDYGPNEGAIVGVCSNQKEAYEWLVRLSRNLTRECYIEQSFDYCRAPGKCYVYRAFKVPQLTGLLDSISSTPLVA